jgi:hypothetical protein
VDADALATAAGPTDGNMKHTGNSDRSNAYFLIPNRLL